MNSINVSFKKIDKSLPDPSKGTEDSAGIDLYVRDYTVVSPKEVTYVPLNVVMKVPVGCYGLLSLRSSTPKKKGLMMANGVGIIDSDYCGENDEIMIPLITIGDEPVVLMAGDRIAQVTIHKIPETSIHFVEKMSDISRGGFGSTDKK